VKTNHENNLCAASSVGGAPEEIRTPDPQIRSLEIARKCAECRQNLWGRPSAQWRTPFHSPYRAP